MFERDVAPGVHRVEDAYTNWYLVEDEGRLTLIDAGLPASWGSLLHALRELGRSIGDIEAVVLTHAHFDHVGTAERLRADHGVPVWVHEADESLAHHPLRYDHERSRLWYAARPRAVPIGASLLRAGTLHVQPVRELRTFRDGEVLPVPGRPEVVFTPGHTYGHCALHMPSRDLLFAGDAFVNLDPYTGKRGPRLVARAATADVDRALRSLERLAMVRATTVLTGHGEPWREGVGSGAALAHAAGAA